MNAKQRDDGELVKAGATYHVTLADKTLSADHYPNGYIGNPPCTGIDSLAAGVSVDIAMPQDSAHVDAAPSRCWVAQGVVTSDVGMTLAAKEVFFPVGEGTYSDAPMFFASGQFSSGDCNGRWGFVAMVRPADTSSGTPAHEWAGRVIEVDATTACEAAFPTIASAPLSRCYDDWDIDVQAK